MDMHAPLDSTAEQTSKVSTWANRLISAFLGIVATVSAALLIGRLQAHEPRLVYTSTESLPFNGPNGDVSIYQVGISNDGNQEVNEVACAIRIPAAKIDQYKITASPLLNAGVSISGDTLNIMIPNLNPSESVQVSVLATGSQSLPGRPVIAVRGRGVTGSERSDASTARPREGLPVVVLTAATLSILLYGIFARLLRRVPSLQGDQRQVLAYICRACGLGDLAEEYSARPHETSYRAESDRMAQAAIDTADPARMLTVERALLTLVEYTKMAQISKAILYYNVALLGRARKDDAACEKYIEMAKKIARGEIERRLKVDPRFKSV